MTAAAAATPSEPTATPAETLTHRAARAFAAYRSGDSHEMGHLVDLLTPILWHTARGAGLAQNTAEDVVQTAWLRLVEHADAIADPQAVLGWLLTTVRRESWRVHRGAGREAGEVPPEIVDPGPTPAASVLAGADQAVLWRHFRELSPRCQALLRVVAFADRPDYASLSQALGMPVGSIGPTRGRCLARLRGLLVSDPTWGGLA